jgi:hypothetical protein
MKTIVTLMTTWTLQEETASHLAGEPSIYDVAWKNLSRKNLEDLLLYRRIARMNKIIVAVVEAGAGPPPVIIYKCWRKSRS